MTVYEILQALAATTKKNEKEDILKQHADNLTLKECFRLAYSPTIQFYMKQIPEHVPNYTDELCLDTCMEDLLRLSSREVTGQAAKDVITETLELLTEETGSIIINILQGDLRCGVGATTINRTWEGLIPKVPQMLASSMKEKTLDKITYPAFAQLKSDGARCIAYCSEDKVTLMSRNGKQYLGLADLEESLKQFAGFVVDGEIIFNTEKADRSTGNGIVTKAVKGTITLDEQKDVVFQVWDLIPINQYVTKGKYEVTEHNRYTNLSTWLDSASLHNVQIIPNTVVASLDEAREVFREYVEQGFEGIILKNMNGIWEDKRSPNLVKLKEEHFADLVVVNYFEGSGKIAGMLGGLTVQTSCGIIKTNVGSGFTEAERKQLWENKEDLLDRIVELRYANITTDKHTSNKSLFLPIFQCFREDKSEANTAEDMQ